MERDTRDRMTATLERIEAREKDCDNIAATAQTWSLRNRAAAAAAAFREAATIIREELEAPPMGAQAAVESGYPYRNAPWSRWMRSAMWRGETNDPAIED